MPQHPRIFHDSLGARDIKMSDETYLFCTSRISVLKMCGLYSIILPPEAIRQIFQTHGELPNLPVYCNAPPTTLPVVRRAILIPQPRWWSLRMKMCCQSASVEGRGNVKNNGPQLLESPVHPNSEARRVFAALNGHGSEVSSGCFARDAAVIPL
jgi:hypothetical protein